MIKNKKYLIGGALIAVGVIYFLTSKKKGTQNTAASTNTQVATNVESTSQPIVNTPVTQAATPTTTTQTPTRSTTTTGINSFYNNNLAPTPMSVPEKL